MKPAAPNLNSHLPRIEEWFKRSDDSDFAVLPTSIASQLEGNFELAQTIIYTTKQHCLSRILGISELPNPIASVGRYGLPAFADLRLFRRNSVTLLFIGDADPVDLLVFSWLREHVPFAWYGINDLFLEKHGTRDTSLIHLQLSESERLVRPHLDAICPNYRELLGPYCSALLDNGYKIELEGAIMGRAR